MKKYNVIFLLLIIFGGSVLGSNDGDNSAEPVVKNVVLKGRVVDFKTGEALTGVEVSISGTEIVSYTDLDGNFEIKEMQPGTYSIIASLISYKNSLIENFEADNSENTVDIKLQVSD
jgi:hypothetical protein